MVKDARRLMIPQPEGSNVYFRALTQVVWFAMQDDLPDVLSIDETLSMSCETRWAPHMPLARKLVHPA